jgi:hypothetical protein
MHSVSAIEITKKAPTEKSKVDLMVEEIGRLHKERGKKKANTEESIQLVDKLLKNIVDNSNEAKFRQVKRVRISC